MEPLAVDDDICILKHETAFTTSGESPVSVCAGDESVASHFALVTAYEDIKKRLRDTERENTLLRKRVKQLEDKLFRPDAPPSEGPQYVNKAFSAYRGIYIEKEDLQMELNKLKKEKSESERLLMEQLQAKEWELLQLRTEMDTSQGTVMKSLNSPQDYWQVDRVSTELKIHKLQEELERVTLENSRLLERGGEEPHGLNGPDLGLTCDTKFNASERNMQQMCQALNSEVNRLVSELKHQSGLISKLRPLINETRQASSTVPIQCLDDVEKNNHPGPRASVPRPPSAPPLPSCSGRPCPPVGGPSGTLLPDSLKEDCWYNGPWPSHSCSEEALAGSNAVLPPPPLNQASLDESSRSFPSPPKPSDAIFWEGHSAASSSSSLMGNCSPRSPPNTEWAKPY
ncbi:5-azacytidine-induced protein 2 isoform X1 [Solea solea]|uniref:5-azacytidine-induced protein 2 isoform X1 n=1 Tax=Solea solea TaxID=90069 RepID=UPI00272A333B|nr:5-azacytidine-induced protein 2 isoform X1 [Solea solea]